MVVIGTIGGTKITLVNLYAPNEDCPNFFKMMASLLADKAEGIISIGGDFNCVLRQTVKIQIGPKKHFKYWRLNVSLLNDEAIQQEIRKSLTDYLKYNDNGTVSPSSHWEAAKVVMRGNIIAISSRLKKQRLAQQVELEREIKKLETRY